MHFRNRIIAALWGPPSAFPRHRVGVGLLVVAAALWHFPAASAPSAVSRSEGVAAADDEERFGEGTADTARKRPTELGESGAADSKRPRASLWDTPPSLQRVEIGLRPAGAGTKSYPMIAGKTYVLGPYDELQISVRGWKTEDWALVVAPQGVISIPLVGSVKCAGLTISELEKSLARELGRYLRDFTVNVVVTRLRGIEVTVTGQVTAPGSFSLPGLVSLWEAVQTSGGITSAGSVRDIQVRDRNGKERAVDLYPFLFGGRADCNPSLQPGDTVHVPVAERIVGLSGEVRRSGLYEFRAGENLSQLLSLGGGPTAEAALDKAYVVRVLPDRTKLMISVNLAAAEAQAPPRDLRDGDILFIPPVGLFLGKVRVSGEVRKPGRYERRQNMRLSDLLDLAGGCTGTAVPSKAYLHRVREDRSLQVIQVDAAKALADDARANIPLAEGDALFVPSADALAGTVTVRGEVNKPLAGQPFARGMTVRDLVGIAGGIKVRAASANAYIQRVFPGDQTNRYFFVNVAHALEGDPAHNLELQDGDVLVIPDLTTYSGKVTVGGEVRAPQECVLAEGMRARDLLSIAGGLTVRAAPAQARIERVASPGGGKQYRWLDLARAEAGDSENNPLLQDGDLLVVPAMRAYYGRVSVSGELRAIGAMLAEQKSRQQQAAALAPQRTATDKQGQDEREGVTQRAGADTRAGADESMQFDLAEGMRVSDLVKLAGGTTAMAALERARLVRVGAGGLREAVHLNLAPILNGVGDPQDLVLRDGDSLLVPSVAVLQRTVRVAGELIGAGVFEAPLSPTGTGGIKRRGLYELKEGDTVRDLVQAVGGVTAYAALRAARIDRPRPDGTLERIPVDLHRLLVEKDDSANVVLQNGDEFTVPAIADMVYVVGAVANPGAYEYREGNNRVLDMIARAGGATPRAALSSVRLVRSDKAGKHEPIRVNMDAIQKRGQMHLDPGVNAGDVIFVPEKTVVVQDLFQLLANISLLRFYFGQ